MVFALEVILQMYFLTLLRAFSQVCLRICLALFFVEFVFCS